MRQHSNLSNEDFERIHRHCLLGITFLSILIGGVACNKSAQSQQNERNTTKDTYEEASCGESSNDYYVDETPSFRSAYDVINYLAGESFTDDDQGITIRFKSDGMYASGRQLTGAIQVEDFNSTEAIFSCTSPYNGATYRFHLIQGRCVQELHSGETYYIN